MPLQKFNQSAMSATRRRSRNPNQEPAVFCSSRNDESQYHINRRENTMRKLIIISTLAVASILTAAQAALAADHDITFEACSPLNATNSYTWVDGRGTRHTLNYACRADTHNRQTWAVTSRS
jgi:hypothetical protein